MKLIISKQKIMNWYRRLKKRKGSTIVQILSLTILIVALLIPVFMLSLAISKELNGSYYWQIHRRDFWIFISVFGIVTLLIRWIDIRLNENKDSLKNIGARFRFITINARNAWTVGISLSLIITGGYLIFNARELYVRYDAIFTIIISIIALTLAAEVLYKSNAPLIGTDDLLRAITEDLKRVQFSNPKIWIVYIAPNIGFYRNYLKNPDIYKKGFTTERNVFNDFYFQLEKVSRSYPSEFGLITYKRDYFKEIYKVYDRIVEAKNNNGSKPNDIVEMCVKSADSIIELFENTPCKDNDHIIKIAQLPKGFPFPNSVIVINNTVYYISSYGIPTWFPPKNNEQDGNNFNKSNQEKEIKKVVGKEGEKVESKKGNLEVTECGELQTGETVSNLIKENGKGPNGNYTNGKLADDEYGDFEMVEGEKGLAELISWRYQDSILADTVIAHLKRIFNEFKHYDQETTK